MTEPKLYKDLRKNLKLLWLLYSLRLATYNPAFAGNKQESIYDYLFPNNR